MRTHPDHLRQGAAAALLAHIIGQARRRGLLLYMRSAFNRFLHLPLGPAPAR